MENKLVVLPRTEDRVSRIAAELRAAGVEVIELRCDEAPWRLLGERIPDMIVFPSSGSVAAAAPYLVHLRERSARPGVAAIGPASAAAARTAGFEPDVIAARPSIDALLLAVCEHLERA
ncbi:MAG: uroporphyrinogen-III synthase [Candidatus Baltobacteraceae bacterium]